MKMYSKEGNVMMDTKSLRREGDVLIMKGKMMEAMSTGICPSSSSKAGGEA
ncbi:MAG: hypothetical protein JRF34_08085 [Deltaproteobacteria bacterium]|nr:hypothetical protein [Deltaproteobacteria bacterium]